MKTSYSPKTKAIIQNARKSFETITGKSVTNATVKDIEQWLNTLRNMGRSVNTCRTYLSFVKQLSDKEADMPARENTQRRELSDAEIKTLYALSPSYNRSLAIALILCGSEVLTWTWRMLTDLDLEISIPAKLFLVAEAGRRGKETNSLLSITQAAHWVNGNDPDEFIFPHDNHEVNRRLKSTARKAGIQDEGMNITAIKYTRRRLFSQYRNMEAAANSLGIEPGLHAVRRHVKKADPRLHGIGRRSNVLSVMKTA